MNSGRFSTRELFNAPIETVDTILQVMDYVLRGRNYKIKAEKILLYKSFRRARI